MTNWKVDIQGVSDVEIGDNTKTIEDKVPPVKISENPELEKVYEFQGECDYFIPKFDFQLEIKRDDIFKKTLDDKKASDKAAATTKLKALGLTDDEISALTGS